MGHIERQRLFRSFACTIAAAALVVFVTDYYVFSRKH